MKIQWKEREISNYVINILESLRLNGKLTYFINIEGGKRDKRQQASLKMQGVRSGRPDIEIITDNKIIFIELKRLNGGVVSKNQREQIKELNKFNAEVHIIRALDGPDAVSQIKSKLDTTRSL